MPPQGGCAVQLVARDGHEGFLPQPDVAKDSAMGQPSKVDVEAPAPVLKRSPTLRTRDTVGLRDALLARKAKKLQATRLGFLCLYVTLLFGVWILALRHNRISLYELEYSPSRPVWKSKGHGASDSLVDLCTGHGRSASF